MKLNQTEKNALYYCFERHISERLSKLSSDMYDKHMEYIAGELGDIRDEVDLLDKLGKDGWALWEDEE